MKLIMGLGNPGREYEGTRHNVGFEVVDLLAARHGIQVKRRRYLALVGEGEMHGEKVVLAKPQTFMNLSGHAARELQKGYKVYPRDVIVIHDDMDLEFARIRIKNQGRAVGHRGVESVQGYLASDEFIRVRVGIGRPPGGDDAADFVLQRFLPDEREAARKALEEAADAVDMILRDGLATAMTHYNRPPAKAVRYMPETDQEE